MLPTHNGAHVEMSRVVKKRNRIRKKHYYERSAAEVGRKYFSETRVEMEDYKIKENKSEIENKTDNQAAVQYNQPDESCKLEMHPTITIRPALSY